MPISLGIAMVIQLLMLFREYLPYFSGSRWAGVKKIKLQGTMEVRTLSFRNSNLDSVMIFEFLCQCVFIIGISVLLYLFLVKSRHLRKLFTIVGSAYLIFGIAAFAIAMAALFDEVKNERMLYLLLVPSFLVGVWIPFIRTSERVKRIFVN